MNLTPTRPSPVGHPFHLRFSTSPTSTVLTALINCPVDLCIVFETETLDLFNFTIYSTLFTRPVDPRIVFETSIRRIAMFHGGEQWAWIDD